VISPTQIKSLIKSTCEKMGEKFASDDAVTLVHETGLVESGYKYLRQLGDGPAKSFYQIEPASCVDSLVHYLKHRRSLMGMCAEASMVDLKHWQSYDEKLWSDILEKNIAAGIVHCRIKYWRVPKPMPNTLEGRAKYWKKYYNTDQGKGTEEKYIDTVREYL
jgi:hypothetical protein|tara:strand:+ start:137 stop:622 length:486 start_codon:yes stop_codon:yes gene_type:complete